MRACPAFSTVIRGTSSAFRLRDVAELGERLAKRFASCTRRADGRDHETSSDRRRFRVLRRCLRRRMAEQPLVGIVSISATEANNARYIAGAQAAAKEHRLAGLGHRRRRQCRPGQRRHPEFRPARRRRDRRHGLSLSPRSAPASMRPRRAKIPVVTWGGGLGGGVAATNGSGGPMAVPVNELMLKTMGGKGAMLALTYHTGEVCRNREVELDKALAKSSRHQGDQERGPHPRLFRGRRAIRQRLARLASGGRRRAWRSGAAGTIRPSARSARCAHRAARTSRSMASTATPRRSRTSRRAS